MKTCPNCNTQVEDNFQLCWNCNYSFDEQKVVEIKDVIEQGNKRFDCMRCDVPLVYTGNYRFHEGNGKSLNNGENFEVYVCPDCGKAEFFFPEV